GSADVAAVYAEQGAGGIQFSGAAIDQVDYSHVGTGGLTLGGSATVTVQYSIVGAGGIVLAGSATVSHVQPGEGTFNLKAIQSSLLQHFAETFSEGSAVVYDEEPFDATGRTEWCEIDVAMFNSRPRRKGGK